MPALPITLAQALTAPTVAGVVTDELAVIQANGVPTTDWGVGAPQRTFLLADAQGTFDFSLNAVPAIIAGGYASLAAGPWLALVAANVFGLLPFAATYTIGQITLHCNASSGPYTQVAGAIQIADIPTGHVFTNVAPVTIPNNGNVNALFRALQPGTGYNLSSGTTWTLLTPLPGVTVTNPAPVFTSVGHVGSGSGTVSPAAAGTPLAGQVTIKVSQAGTIGVTTVKVQFSTLDSSSGDGSYSPSTTISGGALTLHRVSSNVITGTAYNVVVTFSGTFVLGDIYTFSEPGSWLTATNCAPARDTETDQQLSARCLSQWATLGTGATAAAYVAWALIASTEVVAAYVSVDGTVAGQVDVVVASSVGPVSGAGQAAVLAYLLPRVPLTTSVVVSSASAIQINAITGVVLYRQSGPALSTIQAGAQNAVSTYCASIAPGSTVYLNEVIRYIEDQTGVLDCTVSDWQDSVNGDDGTSDIVLSSTQVARFTAALSSSLTWTPQ